MRFPTLLQYELEKHPKKNRQQNDIPKNKLKTHIT